MWSWGKIGKEWNSNAYYCQVNISESPQSTLNNYIVSNGNIFPNLAQITMSFRRVQVDRNRPMAGFFPLWSIINAPLTRQKSQYSCQWPGILKPPGSYPGEGARAPALLTHWHSSPWPARIMSSQTFSLFLLLPLVYIFPFVDNNLMCLETASSAYVTLGIILILLQMVWSIIFSQNEPWTLNHFCHISALTYKIHLGWLQSFFH